MYGIFIQGRDGFHWLENAATEAEARERIASDDFDHQDDVDFVMVLPITAFRDLDGERG